MRYEKSGSKFCVTLLCVAALCLCWSVPPLEADECDDLAKQIEKTLSGVKRRIVTEPSRAEKEFIQAQGLFEQLKAKAPKHAKISAIETSMGSLRSKLEKRLGRPIGGAGEKKEEKPKPETRKEPASSLPSSVTSRLNKVSGSLSAAVAALEKNQLQTANRKVGEAQKVMNEINKRYAAKIPADNVEFKAAVARLKDVSAKVAAANATASEAAAAAAAVKEAKEAQSAEWYDRLEPFFDSKSDSYLLMGAAFNRATDEEKKKTRDAYARANELMPVYKATEFPHGRTNEIENLARRLDEYLTMYNEEEARARQAESCKEWVDALRTYVDVGAGSRKHLIASTTLDETEIENRAALLEEAKKLWAEYTKAEFPLGKSPRLIDLEKEMEERLKEMPETLRQSRALVSGNIEKEFERILNYLAADTGWKTDTSKTPNIVMKRDVDALRQAMERFAGTVDPGDAKLSLLKKTLARIEEQDRQNRAVRAERTYMLPERYEGGDSDYLRQKAVDIVLAKFDGAKNLKISLSARDWKEERVVEWTDTTRTAWQYRNTRFMTAQVAAKGKDGKVFLHSVHLASDRSADGAWGPLYGHVMWSDWMAEKNIRN